MTANAFDRIDDWLASAATALAPQQRRKVFREILRDLRKRNQQRITKQEGPDGEKWTPRKRGDEGHVRSSAKMLVGLRSARRMAIKSDSDGGTIGYRGRTARIAAVHHYGRVDEVAEDGPRVKYPARPVLGISTSDVTWIRQRLMDHIADSVGPGVSR